MTAEVSVTDRMSLADYAPNLREGKNYTDDTLESLAARTRQHADWLDSVVDRARFLQVPMNSDWENISIRILMQADGSEALISLTGRATKTLAEVSA
jgi:hypothetical protein